jgi:hypothetical protein
VSYYNKTDHELAVKLRIINRAVVTGWLTAKDAAAMARVYDPEIHVCDKCGHIGGGCDCTVSIPVSEILEAMRRDATS